MVVDLLMQVELWLVAVWESQINPEARIQILPAALGSRGSLI